MRLLLLISLLLGSFHLSGSESPEALCRRVLAEAEALGMPLLTDATLFQGRLDLSGRNEWEHEYAARAAPVHARLKDGSWLAELTVPLPADRLPADQLAALTPWSPPSAAERVLRGPDQVALLAWARRIALGDAWAIAGWRWRDITVRHRRQAYPRPYAHRDDEIALRLACSSWFTAQEPTPAMHESAVAIVPPAWRIAVRERLHPAPAMHELTESMTALVQWSTHQRNEAPPSITEDALIALAGDQRVTPAGTVIGDLALSVLALRWGVDPALVAERAPDVPWDAAEREAVARGLAAWSGLDRDRSLVERFAPPLVRQSVATWSQALRQLSQLDDERAMQRQYQRRSANADPDWPALPEHNALTIAVLDATLKTWEGLPAGTMPPSLSTAEVAYLLSVFSGGISYRGNDRPANLDELLNQMRAVGQRGEALAAHWPRTGEAAEALIRWDDSRGRPAAVDARVTALLHDPVPTRDQLRIALVPWLERLDATRWETLCGLLTRPSDDAVGELFRAELGGSWGERHQPYGITPLLWLALGDQRPSRSGTPLAHVIAERLIVGRSIPCQNPADLKAVDALVWPASHAQAARDAMCQRVRTLLAPLSANLLTHLKVPLPDGLAAPASLHTQPGAVPGLTTDEKAAILAALTAAESLGFPSLVDAAVVCEAFPSLDPACAWWGVHLRLADGSWLAELVHPVAAAHARNDVAISLPNPGRFTSSQSQRLPAAVAARAQANVGLGWLQNGYDDAVVPALAWWRSGADAKGQTVVAAVLREAELGHDLAEPLSLLAARGGEERAPCPNVPDLAQGVRRALARWFRGRLAHSTGPSEATRWAAAVRSILDSRDRADWEPLVLGLLGRAALPLQIPVTAPLDERLQCWMDRRKDERGHWLTPRVVPATRADTAGLLVLLGDQRPTRWLSSHDLPRPLGDAALAALAEIWGFDWRWLVRDAPPFADLLNGPAREMDPVAGDIWLWACTNWTTQRRAALALALQRWWADRPLSAPTPTIAVLRTLPPEEWRGLFAHLTAVERADPALGEVIAARLQAAPAPAVVSTRSLWPGIELLGGIACQPQHPAILAAITDWPTGRTRTAALALRSELARDPGGADAWFADALGGRLGEPDPEGYGRRAALTPWITIGCWLHRPNPDRLARLRAAWQLEPTRPLWCWLAIQLGRRTWPGHQLLGDTHPAESLIPLTLLGDALADVRPLTQPARNLLITWAGWQSSELAAAAQALPTDARVCDWAIVCLLTHDALISAPAGAGDLSTFIAKPLAARTTIVQEASASTKLALTTLQSELSLQQAAPNDNGF